MKSVVKNLFAVLFLMTTTALYAQIQVSIPNTSGNVGEVVSIPLNTDNVPASDEVVSYETEVHFDVNVLRPVEIVKNGTIIDSGDWMFMANPNYGTGVIKFGAMSTGAYLSGSGAIAYMKFEVIGEPGSTSPLNLVNFSYNGDDPPAEATQNGVFTINYATINIETNPSGRSFEFDGDTYTAPQTFKVTPGSSHTLNVTDPQMEGSDTRYVWSSWSDGEAKSHSITAPAANGSMTVTAAFTKEFHLGTDVSPSGGGSISKSPDQEWFADGASVTLTATPATEYDFSEWTGSASGSANPLTLTMNQARNVTANFTPWPTITIDTNPSGLKVLIDGSEYTAPQNRKWQPGTNHEIGVNSPQEVSGDTRYVYDHWSDGQAQTHDIATPSADQTFTASFNTQYKLSLSANPDAGGSVSADPSDVWQDENAVVTVNASANAGFQFVGWDGDLGGTQNPAIVTMNAPKNIIGNFGETTTITIHTNPEGLQIWVDDSNQPHTAPYSFTALTNTRHTIGTFSPQNETATSRLRWDSWTDGQAQSHEIVVSSSTTSYTANFVQQYKLNTSVLPSGAGNVSTSPSGPWYDSGTDVTLTASAEGSYDFQNWSGGASGTSATTHVTMNSSKDVTANFKAWPHITIATNPTDLAITVDGNPGTAPQVFQWKPGTSHTISVDSPQGAGSTKQYVFQSWSDGKDQEHSIVTPSEDATFTANFKTQYKLTTSVNPAEGGRIDRDKPGPWYDSGEVVTLTEVPASEYDFDEWTGDAGGSDTSVQVTMNAGKAVIAHFKHWPAITIATQPAGMQIMVDGTAANAPQTFTWQPGSSHTIEAIAEQNEGATKKYVWTNWSDGKARTHDIQTPQTNTTFTANYKTQFYVQTQALPAAEGSVSPSSGWYDAGTQLSFEATPNSGYGFLNWSGSWSGDENPRSVTVNSAIDVTANFSEYRRVTIHTDPEGLRVKSDGTEGTAPVVVNWLIGTTHSVEALTPQNAGSSLRYIWKDWSDGGNRQHSFEVTNGTTALTARFSKEYYVTTRVNPEGAGSVSPGSGWYAEGSSVTFSTEANEGYEFLNWSGDASGTATSVQVHIDGPKTLIANYNEWYQVTVVAQKTGATQTILQIIVDGETHLSPYSFRAQPGSVHTIEAPEIQTPEGEGRRYLYIDWSDRGERSHTITVSRNNMEFDAHYKLQFHLSTSIQPENSGSIQTDGENEWITAWKTISVTGVANTGYVFNEWQGDLSGKQNPTSLYMDGPKSIKAVFDVAQTAVRFLTDPSNQPLLIDGALYDTPVTFNWSVGETHSVEAPDTLSAGDSIRYVFDHWKNEGGRRQTIHVGTENEEWTAYFNSYYHVTGSTSHGNLSGFGWYPLAATAAVSVDSIVQVNSSERFLFAGWTGDINSTQASLQFEVMGPIAMTATFVHQYALGTRVEPFGAGQITLQPKLPWYGEGTEVIAEAVPNSGFLFQSWSGLQSGAQNPINFAINSADSLVAHFAEEIKAPVVASFEINKYAIVRQDTIRLFARLEDGTVCDSLQMNVIWYRNGEPDTLFSNRRFVPPEALHVGDVWYTEFRVQRAGLYSRWHRSNTCPVLPVLPVASRTFEFTGNDTTVTAGDDSTRLTIHLTSPGGDSQPLLGEPDTLEHYINVQFIRKSSQFYFNNTLDWYLLVTTNASGFEWSFSYQYTDNQIVASGISLEDSLTLGWSEDFGNSWHYLNDVSVDTASNRLQATGIAHFSLWAVGQNPFSQFFPVELNSFTAKPLAHQQILLKWQTRTETNNLGFEVQRETESGSFAKIGFVRGHGSTTTSQNYQFVDQPKKPGKYAYRLKQIDMNGHFQFSEIVQVTAQFPATLVMLKNYPNPFNGGTVIQFSIPENYSGQKAVVKIYDIMGKEIKRFTLHDVEAGFHEFHWNGVDQEGSSVSSGIFFYRLQIGPVQKMSKMILLK